MRAGATVGNSASEDLPGDSVRMLQKLLPRTLQSPSSELGNMMFLLPGA